MNIMSNNKKIDKKRLLLALEKTPIIEQACRTVNVPRSNYYRWRKEDPLFKEKADEAIEQSVGIITDLAVSMLVELIKAGHYQAIIFWLSRRDKAFVSITREELRNNEMEGAPLSDEAKAILEKAIGSNRGRKEPPPNEPIALVNGLSSGGYPSTEAIEVEIISTPRQPNNLLPLNELKRMVDEHERLARGVI